MIFLIISIGVITLGALILLSSFFVVRALVRVISDNAIDADKPERATRLWKILNGLILFFLLAYILIIVLLVLENTSAILTLTSLVFFLGAVFILVTAAFSFRSTQFLIEARQKTIETKNTLLNSFARFVPPQFIHYLDKEDVTQISAGDSVSKQFSILFCDIRGFSTISHQLSEKNAFDFLNHCYNSLTPAIEQNGGFVDQFIGDALMAVFDSSSDQVLRAAIEMQQIADKLKVTVKGSQQQVRIGIGINTGHVSLGALGTGERITSTVIGDSVNLASRIEGLTKEYTVPIIATRSTIECLQKPEGFDLKEIGSVTVKGISTATTIYQVVGLSGNKE